MWKKKKQQLKTSFHRINEKPNLIEMVISDYQAKLIFYQWQCCGNFIFVSFNFNKLVKHQKTNMI